MGLTIHYSLKSDAVGPEQACQLVEQLRQAALDLAMAEVGDVVDVSGAECDFRNAEDGSLRWLLVQARRLIHVDEAYHLVAPNRLFAFSAWPGEGCEAANFGLAIYPDTIPNEDGDLSTGLSGWSWESFCKTQYAANPTVGGTANFVRCHVAVIELLDRAKALGILESVEDEGHFWEKRNVGALVETVGQWNSHVAAVVGQFKDQLPGAIVAPITEYPNFEHLEADGWKEKGRGRGS